MRDYQANLLKRASLWVLGQALPDAHALRAPARMALTGVVVAAAAGTLLALGVVAALIGMYLYLVGEGVSPGASLLLVGTMGALAGMLTYFIARRRVEDIPSRLDELKMFTPHHHDLLGDLFNLVVSGFLEGVSKPEPTDSKAAKTREEIEAQIEMLIDTLEKLEADAEHAVEETAEEVVLEIERHKKRPKQS